MRSTVVIAFRIVALAGISTAASAQGWRLEPRVQRELQTDVDQLSTLVARHPASTQERRELEDAIHALDRSFVRFTHDGLDRDEISELQSRVNIIRRRLRLDLRHWTTAP